MHFSPWHLSSIPKDYPRKGIRAHTSHLELLSSRLGFAAHNAEIKVVILDHEYFEVWASGTESARHHNLAITEKLNAVDRIVREVCPDADVIWYGAPNNHGLRPELMQLDYYAPSLYCPHKPEQQIWELAKSEGRAIETYIRDKWLPALAPFISFGCGYNDRPEFVDQDYPLEFDRQIGFNAGAGIVRSRDRICLYPGPRPAGFVRRPGWWDHFEAWAGGYWDGQV